MDSIVVLRKEEHLNAFRCPCCNEELDSWEIDMYDIFGGMREDCYNESMAAAYDFEDNKIVQDLDLDLRD